MIKIEIHSTRAVIRYQEPLTVGLRGAKVRFSFGSPWEGLSKIAVFRQGEKTVTVADVGEEVIIPWEVLTQPGSPVQIGVYGRDSTGTVAIPTVWTETAAVRPGADPEGDPSTEPTPGLWEQLQGKMGSLGRLNTATKDSLVGAINEATRAFCLVTVTKNEDGSYSADKTSQQLLTAKNMGKVLLCQLDSLWLTLSSVYNTATFEFTTVKKNTKCCITIHPDGTISYQADVLATGESRLPNPKKITITGASTAEYDGSDEVEVQVPYKTSQLENDSGFLTTAPVTSVNGQTGEVKLPTVVKVTITEQADGTIEPNLPHEDILAAYNAGNTVCCEYKGRLLPLIVASPAICSFGCVHSGKVYAVNITRASTVASVAPLTSGDSGSAPADAVLHTPQVLTPEQKAQARENIGVSQKQEVEVVLNDVGASLVDASVKTVFDSIDSGNTVVLYRNMEDGTRVYYQLRERKEDAGGGESLTFTYRSTVVIDDIILHRGGFFNGSIGHGTENLTADTVGAVPAPMTAEIGQAMCVTEVDEDGKPVGWGVADLAGGGSETVLVDLTTEEDVSEIKIPLAEYVDAYNKAREITLYFHLTKPSVDESNELGKLTASISYDHHSGTRLYVVSFLNSEVAVPTNAISYIGSVVGSVCVQPLLANRVTHGSKVVAIAKQNQASTARLEPESMYPIVPEACLHITATHPMGKGSHFYLVVR